MSGAKGQWVLIVQFPSGVQMLIAGAPVVAREIKGMVEQFLGPVVVPELQHIGLSRSVSFPTLFSMSVSLFLSAPRQAFSPNAVGWLGLRGIVHISLSRSLSWTTVGPEMEMFMRVMFRSKPGWQWKGINAIEMMAH